MSSFYTPLRSIPIVETPEQYDSVVDAICIPDTSKVDGVGSDDRFERLPAEKLASLSDWYIENGGLIRLRVASIDMALHVKGAVQVKPDEPWNYVRGSGKDRTYWYCNRNTHNRDSSEVNKGQMTKEGLRHDLRNGYFVPGPVGHIDWNSVISSLQHRIDAAIDVADSTGEFPVLEVFVFVGLPSPLNAAIDRSKPKDGKDQETIDRTVFVMDDVCDWSEYVPEDFRAFRSKLTASLVTARNNVFSRMNGTGFHPSKANQPSTRQALALQDRFADYRGTHGPQALERLVVECQERSTAESGTMHAWAKHVSPGMLTTLCVLASNVDTDTDEPIEINSGIVDQILGWFGVTSAEGDDGYSSYIREIAKQYKKPIRPAGMARWIFWGLVSATVELLENGSLSKEHFPNVNATLIKGMKAGKCSYPVFGGLDCGVVDDE